MKIDKQNIKNLSEVGSRGAFGRAIMELGETRKDVIVVTADLSDATRVTPFGAKYPDRFFNIGIAEQNMIGIAAGMAREGKTVFATTFAAFACMRACEQVRTDVCYPNENVKIIGADSGVVMGTLGYTHYCFEDIAILRSMPNMTLLSPADGLEIFKATIAASQIKGPVYIRLTGAKDNPIVYDQDYEFDVGRAVRVMDGRDAAIFATGASVAMAVSAARQLKKQGVAARVVDIHTLKPLDEKEIKAAVRDTGLIVTVEEHSIYGGLGAAVAEVVAETGNAPRVVRIGHPDSFNKIGTYPDQLKRFGLTGAGIFETIVKNLKSTAVHGKVFVSKRSVKEIAAA